MFSGGSNLWTCANINSLKGKAGVRVWLAGGKKSRGPEEPGLHLQRPCSGCLQTWALQPAGLWSLPVPYSLLRCWDGPVGEGRGSSGKGFFLRKKQLA